MAELDLTRPQTQFVQLYGSLGWLSVTWASMGDLGLKLGLANI